MEKKDFNFEIKSIDEKGRFSGYASTFANVDLVGDRVVKGAFTETLKKGVGSVMMFWQHKSEEIVGEFIRLEEDEKGLFFEGQLFIKDILRAKEANFLMLKKLIKAVSIGYRIESKSFENGVRLLKQIDLLEISLVTYPANPSATIDAVKSIKELSKKELEQKLRDVGFSQKEAKGFIAVGFDGLKERDAVDDHKQTEADEAIFINLMTGKL